MIRMISEGPTEEAALELLDACRSFL